VDQPVVIQQPDRPQMTLEAPAGWRVRTTKRQLILTRDGRRVVVRQCRLDRAERDMTGRRAARKVRNGIPVRGGGCLIAKGAPKLKAQLGSGPRPRSNLEAERIAREARAKTLGAARVEGTLRAIARNRLLSATWAWDLPARYFRIAATYPGVTYEVVRDRAGGHVRYDERACWGSTPPAAADDAVEPRLELQELDAPPRRATTWRLAYQAPRRLPDGTTLLRWDGFVHDGEALVGPDGLLRNVRIRDHRVAEARAPWSALDVAFTTFGAAVAPVTPQPRCS
jgi:hypothetical protein